MDARGEEPETELVALRVQRLPLSEGIACVRVAGEIDLATVGMLHQAIADAVALRPEGLVMDLEGVTFADSQLVHALENAQHLMCERRSGVRVRPSRSVARVLAICDLDHLYVDRP